MQRFLVLGQLGLALKSEFKVNLINSKACKFLPRSLELWDWFSCGKSGLEVECGYHLCRSSGLICDTGSASWGHDYKNGQVRAQGLSLQENHVFRRRIGGGGRVVSQDQRSKEWLKWEEYRGLNSQGKRTSRGEDGPQYREVKKNEM